MNFTALFEVSPVIQIHLAAALAALLIGGIQLFGPRSGLPHRTLGMLFVGLMVVTAVSAIFIRQINGGQFSPIHIFVPLTLVSLAVLVWNIRRRRVDEHRKSARSLYFGALILPGLFAFLPGRLMWTVFGG